MSAIQAGDMVAVVGTGCSCQERDIGLILGVVAVTFEDRVGCIYCHRINPPGLCAELVYKGRHAWKPLSWLRKIEPLPDDETIEEEATA